jgi:putative transposase
MARLARLAVPGQAHHVMQRGHDGRLVFVDARDRQAFLAALKESADALQVAVHGYVLLDSELHLLVTPRSPEGLSRMMQMLGRRYGQVFNRRHGRRGTLWEGRFRTAPLEAHPWVGISLAWLEQAPVAAGLAVRPADYPWSSAAHHAGLRRDPVLTDHAAYWQLGNTPFEREAAWRGILEQPVTSEQASRLLDAVRRGWPVGGESYLSRLAATVGRPVAPRPRGRPRRTSG